MSDAAPHSPASNIAELALRGTAVLEQGLVPDALLLLEGGDIIWSGPAAHAPEHTAEQTLQHD